MNKRISTSLRKSCLELEFQLPKKKERKDLRHEWNKILYMNFYAKGVWPSVYRGSVRPSNKTFR